MPPFIRRRTLSERIKAYLDPWDILIRLSEELESNDWDQWAEKWATPTGVAVNFVFLIARANSRPRLGRDGDDVFGDDPRGTGIVTWLATLIVHTLSLLSLLNAVHTFHRKRHYRLFETNIDAVPSTPSAHRVKVDSSPLTSSPLRLISSMLRPQEAAKSRARPDASRDVWELAVWDPTPLSLELFCLFSPGHVLVYWLFLPTSLQDPRPSVTVATTVFLGALLSFQLRFLHLNFSQQTKDNALVSKEVLHEYDTKFVHPRTRPLMRDVGTQFTDPSAFSSSDHHHHRKHHKARRESAVVPGGSPSVNHVETHTPKVIINRGFQTKPNANYRSSLGGSATANEITTPSRGPPVASNSIHLMTTPLHQQDPSSPIRPPSSALHSHHQQQQQPRLRPNGIVQQPVSNPSVGDGGNLGVYSHMRSPLKKPSRAMPENYPFAARERSLSPRKQVESPRKRVLSSNSRGRSAVTYGAGAGPGGGGGVAMGVNGEGGRGAGGGMNGHPAGPRRNGYY